MFRRLLAGSSLILLLSGFLVLPVDALTVSPVKLELRGDPGVTVGGTFQLMNEQDSTLTFYVSYANFEAEGETGVPHFTEGSEDLATWIRLVPNEMNSVTLEPGQTMDIPYEVLIPEDAAPGGHFGAIFWGSSPVNGESAEALAVGAKVGILMFLTVNGEIGEAGGLLEFGIVDDQSSFEGLPVPFYYRLQNAGSDRVIPQGTLAIKNFLGITTDVVTLNTGESNVLPTTIRRFEEVWGEELVDENTGFLDTAKAQWEQFAFGYYTAELEMTYGSNPTPIVSSVGFWVFPWQLLCLTFGFGIVALSLFVFVLKRYNRWIVAQALAAQKTAPIEKKTPAKKTPRPKKRP